MPNPGHPPSRYRRFRRNVGVQKMGGFFEIRLPK
jgi:hypothetical protein